MRNLRKLTAVVIAIALVLTSMTAVFAASTSFDFEAEAGVIKDLGLWTGNDDGDLMLGSELTRAQGAVLVLKAVFGKTNADAADADPSVYASFDDAAEVPGWAKGWIALAVEAGVVNGSNNNLKAGAPLLGKDLASMFMNALGYADENDYGTSVELLAAKTNLDLVDSLIDDLTNAKLTRDAAAAIVFDALTATAADAEVTLVEALVAGNDALKAVAEKAGLIEAVKAVALDVKSASAVTSAKIKVVLNAAATQADVDAATISFVDKDAKAVAVKSSTIAADGKSFIVVTDAMTAGALYKLTIGDVTKSIVGLPVDTLKPAVLDTSVVDTNTTYKVVFSEKVDDVLATNIANYSIDNSLTVLKAELGSDGVTVTLTTSEQKVGTIYTLTIQNVADFSGNVMDKATKVFGGMAPDTIAPTVDAASVVETNTTYKLVMSEKMNKEVAQNIANYSIDNGLTVLKAELDKDGLFIIITTSEQKVGTIYTLTIQNLADLKGNVMDKVTKVFGGMAPDDIAPTVEDTSVVETNTSYKLVMSEKMNKDTAENIANYSVDNGLQVIKAALSDDGLIVTLTTTEQKVGIIYTLTIQNLADLKGNVMKKATKIFGGMAVDKDAPTVNSVTVSDKTVIINFNEALSSDLATELGNYSFDGGLGYPTAATLSNDKKAVTLTTIAQTPAKVYTLTINNVTDLSGNAIAKDTKKTFIGQGTTASAAKPTVQALSIVNNNTFDVIFDTDIDATTVTVDILKVNNTDYSDPAGLVYKAMAQENKKVARVQFKTGASVNPVLFESGKVYTIAIGGVANINTTDKANEKSLAGTNVANEVPYVVAATPVNTTAVKVIFSEPVKNIGAGAASFTIKQGANSIAIVGNSVADISKAVTEVTLYLSSATQLADGKVYDLTVAGTPITDAAEYVAIKSKNADNSDFKVTFGGTNSVNVAPKIQAVVAIDKYNFDVIFTEEVKGAKDLLKYTITSKDGAISKDGASIAQDGAKITIKLDSAKATLAAGVVYTLELDRAGITDLQDLAYDTATDSNKVVFGGTNATNAVPEIVGVSATAGVTTDAIKVTFSEEVVINITTPNNVFAITAGDTTYTVTSITKVDGSNYMINLSSALTTSAITSIKVKDATLVKDLNGQSAKTDAVNFGAK